MIELQPEIVQTIQQVGTGVFVLLFVTAIVKLLRGISRTVTDGVSVWQNRRAIYLLERISEDVNGIGLKILEIHSCIVSKTEQERLQERDRG